MIIAIAIISFILPCADSNFIFFYQLFQGIGEVLSDFGLDQHHAVNGFTAEVENDSNCIFTDRGGYFDGSTLITPPDNSVVQNPLSVPSSFCLILWIMILSDGVIFSRYDSSNNLLIKISVSSGSMSFRAYTSDQSFPAAGNNGPSYAVTYNEWHFIAAISDYPSSQTDEKLIIESNFNTVTFTGSYTNDGIAYGTNIGCDQTCTGGFTGYIYYIVFENNAESYSSIQAYYSTSCSGCSYCKPYQPCMSTCTNPRYPDSCSAQCNCANNAIASCSDSNINSCQRCDSSCSRTCSGTTSSDCQDIKATYCQGIHPYCSIQKTCLWNVVCPNHCYYCEVDPTCIQCDPGYFLDNTGNCIQCDSSCNGCSGSATHCLSCSTPGYSPSTSNGACQCTTSEYEISSSPLVCGSCHSSCSTCAGSGSNNCNSCADSTIILVSTPGSCSCPSNKYIAQKATLLCKDCDSSCLTCSGPSNNDCLTCSNSIVLASTPSSCTCSSGEYMSVKNPKTCSPCHSSCATCSGGFITNCLSCASSVVMSSSPGQWICAQNQYKSQDSPLVCTDCHPSCSSCSGPLSTDCTSCLDSSRVIASNPGYCDCDASHYIVSKSPFICGDCGGDCYSCFGSAENNCLTCKNSLITPSADGYCKCKDNEYIVSMTSLQCGACDLSCSSCVGPGPDQCLACKDSSVTLKVQPSSCSESSNESSNKSENDLKEYAKAGGYLVSAGLIASGFLISVIEGKAGTLWTYVNIVQLLAFIPLQNIDIPENLYEFWKAFLSWTIIPSLGESFYGKDGVDDVKPYSNWVKYGYKGSSFLVNGGGMLLIALVVRLLWIIVYSLKFYSNEKVQKIIIPLLSKFKYNAFIRLWLEIYILLMAANIVGINNLLFSSPSAFIDSILSIFILSFL
ncbi:unnamed protein product [Blepharisma stoltei]|uniref:TNFR-Cys domain-containing protein n=1 Tax=Blepharisma stoltei TaxID=1481888 RepID=A0AAU9J454_9CILI|nr:unnamed protein product [Blepharisma stoltei]